MIEMSVVCDECSRLIATERTQARALQTARSCGAVRVGRPPKDVCADCADRLAPTTEGGTR